MRRFLAEISQYELPQAVSGRRKKHHLPKSFVVFFLDLRDLIIAQLVVLRRIFYKKLYRVHVARRIKKYAVRSAAVTSCSAGFLIVAFDVLRHAVMYHKRNVGFVDAHPECIRRDHDLSPVVYEIVLISDSFLVGKSRVVSRCLEASGLQ